MFKDPIYRNAFGFALLLHIVLGVLLVVDSVTPTPPAANEQIAAMDLKPKHAPKSPEKPIEASSIDAKTLNKKIMQVKQKKEAARQAEIAQKNALEKEWQMAKQNRIAEEKKLAKIKAQAAARAKKEAEKLRQEQARLREIARKKAEEQKQLAAMQKKQEALKKQQEAEKRKKIAEAKQAREKAEREAKNQQEQQQLALARHKAQMQSEMDKYKSLMLQAISQEWIIPENIDKHLSSEFRVRLAPDGSVLDSRLIKSSGNALLDRSAQTAIYKASPLPVPADRELFEYFRDNRLTVTPKNIRG